MVNEPASTSAAGAPENDTEQAVDIGIAPFRALRFRPDLPGGIAASLGPSYDIESTEQAREFSVGRPYSAVRLELSDPGDELRFAGARHLLDEWRRDGIVTRDRNRSYYVYRQSFDHHGRRLHRLGVFGLVALDAPEVVVLPHEDTWEENLRRRYRLLRDMDASLSPILLLHDQTSGDYRRLLDDITASPPSVDGIDDEGQCHELWIVDAEPVVRGLSEMMRGRRFLIADGHHRFAAARRYHRERRTPESARVLALAIAHNDPGIVLRPIHRLVNSGVSTTAGDVPNDLSRWFDVVEQYPWDDLPEPFAVTLPAGEPLVAGLVTAEAGFQILRLKPTAPVAPLVAHRRPIAVRELDVTIITDVLLKRVLRIDPSVDPMSVHYTTDVASAFEAVRSGAASAAVLLRPPRIEQVLAVARAHGRMPAKSTSFAPKAPFGLVMHDFKHPAASDGGIAPR
jgi:uncharacterized protein (DUF1015 family)